MKQGKSTTKFLRSKSGAEKVLVLAFISAFIASLCPSLAQAAGEKLKVQEICKKDRQQKNGMNENLCGAAKDNFKAKNANTSVAMINSGVAVVCSAACASVTNESVCQYSGMAGAAGTGAVEKNFMAALGPVGEKGLQSATTKKEPAVVTAEATTTTPTEAGTAPSEGGIKAGACITAAQSAKKSYEKFNDAGKNKDGIEDLATNSKKLESTSGKDTPVVPSGDASNSDPRFHQSAMIAADFLPAGSLCSEESIATAVGALACAAQNDPSLPPEVKSGQFLKDLEKITGKSADSFFSEFNNPGQAIMNGLGGKIPAKNQELLAQSLMQMGQSSQYTGSVGTQISGMGHGSSLLKDSNDFDPMSSMNDMMAKLMGGQAEEAQKIADSQELRVGGLKRDPASFASPENKSISLFDRVKWRYGSLIQKQRLGGIGR